MIGFVPSGTIALNTPSMNRRNAPSFKEWKPLQTASTLATKLTNINCLYRCSDKRDQGPGDEQMNVERTQLAFKDKKTVYNRRYNGYNYHKVSAPGDSTAMIGSLFIGLHCWAPGANLLSMKFQ